MKNFNSGSQDGIFTNEKGKSYTPEFIVCMVELCHRNSKEQSSVNPKTGIPFSKQELYELFQKIIKVSSIAPADYDEAFRVYGERAAVLERNMENFFGTIDN